MNVENYGHRGNSILLADSQQVREMPGIGMIRHVWTILHLVDGIPRVLPVVDYLTQPMDASNVGVGDRRAIQNQNSKAMQ